MANHLILRQVLELQFGKEVPSNNAEQRAKDAFLTIGVPALQRVLDGIAPDEKILRLDRVVVDLGRITPGQIVVAFREDLERVAHENLMQLAATGYQGQGGRNLSTQSSDQIGISQGGGQGCGQAERQEDLAQRVREDRIENGTVSLSHRQEIIEFAVHYLESGNAPWWSVARFCADPESAAKIGNELLDVYKDSAALRQKILEIFQHNPRATLTRFVSELWLRPVVDHLRAIGRSLEDNGLSRNGKIEDVLKKRDLGEKHVFDYGDHDFSNQVLFGLVAGSSARAEDSATTLSLARVDNTGGDDEHSIETSKCDASAEEAMLSPSAMDHESTEDATSFIKDRSAQIAFIDDAGIILLQPFMPLLFNELGLLEDNQFASEQCRVKAIRLLEYLAWGTTTRAEFSFQLQKLLCALPASEPLLPIVINRHEITEADSVLNAVIRHWSVLKNTSRDGLRSTFLQRKGKIEFDSERDSLSVEKGSVDVLLGKIPWSYSVVRFPWMPRPLFIEW